MSRDMGQGFGRDIVKEFIEDFEATKPNQSPVCAAWFEIGGAPPIHCLSTTGHTGPHTGYVQHANNAYRGAMVTWFDN